MCQSVDMLQAQQQHQQQSREEDWWQDSLKEIHGKHSSSMIITAEASASASAQQHEHEYTWLLSGVGIFCNSNRKLTTSLLLSPVSSPEARPYSRTDIRHEMRPALMYKPCVCKQELDLPPKGLVLRQIRKFCCMCMCYVCRHVPNKD